MSRSCGVSDHFSLFYKNKHWNKKSLSYICSLKALKVCPLAASPIKSSFSKQDYAANSGNFRLPKKYFGKIFFVQFKIDQSEADR